MNIQIHKSASNEDSQEKKSRHEDDYYMTDPKTRLKLVSPLQFLEETVKMEHLEQGLYALEQEFDVNNTPYDKRNKYEQRKINQIMNLKATNIRQYAATRVKAIQKKKPTKSYEKLLKEANDD